MAVAVSVGREGNKRSMMAATGMMVQGPVATVALWLPIRLGQWSKISTHVGQMAVAAEMVERYIFFGPLTTQ